MTSAITSLPVLETARLGKIGLGCATFGREIDAASSFAMMDYAFGKRITHFDTAAAYAGGHSEQIVGDWIASRRPDALLLGTKMLGPYTPAGVGASVNRSLERLRVGALDIFYFHKWDDTAADPDVLAALDRLVRAGKIRTLGASNFTLPQLERVIRLQAGAGLARMQVLQNNNNFAVRHVDDALRQFCRAQGVAIITFSPLGSGFLTGKHRSSVVPGSRFDLVPNNQKIYFQDEAFRRFARLEAVAARSGLTTVALALAWALHQPGVASVLVGGRKPDHLDQAFAALSIDDPAIWSALAEP